MKHCLSLAFLFLTFNPVWGCASSDPKPQETALEISPETTLITEPLTADGKRVDYLKAYEQQAYPPGWNTDQNGFRLLVEKFGVEADSLMGVIDQTPEEQKRIYAKRMYEKLGLDSAPKLAEPVRDTYDFLRERDKKTHDSDFDTWYKRAQLTNSPWTLKDLPELEPWLEEVAPKLEIVKEAFDKPVFCIPAVSVYGDHPTLSQCDLIAFLQRYREYARALNERAYFRIGTGDMDGAIDDIITIKKIGYHLGQQKMIIPIQVGLAISGIADYTGVDANLQSQASREQLERLLKASHEWQFECDLKTAEMENRYFALDLLQRMATEEDIKSVIDPFFFPLSFFFVFDEKERGKMRDEQYGPFYRMASRINDWNPVLERFNKVCDGNETIDLKEFYDIEAELRGKTSEEWNTFDDSQMTDDERAEFFAQLFRARFCSPNTVPLLREAVARNQCTNNLRQIGLAMLLYHEDYGALPPAFTVDRNGKRLHGWRVLLLPYLGEESLYEKIRLDEPWDSEHNRQFHGELVEVYRCPGKQVFPDSLKPGTTTYSVVLGETSPFNDSGNGRKLNEFGENSRDMILVLETKRPVCWMDPTQEISLSQIENPEKNKYDLINREWLMENIHSSHTGGFNVVKRSGAATFISDTISDERFLGILQGTMLEND